jgi:excisionase family DNA binding protein
LKYRIEDKGTGTGTGTGTEAKVRSKESLGEGAECKISEVGIEAACINCALKNVSKESKPSEKKERDILYGKRCFSSECSRREARVLFENLAWLSSDEAAQYLRLPSIGALRVLVCRRKLPFHKLGRRLRFKRLELDEFLDASRKGVI